MSTIQLQLVGFVRTSRFNSNPQSAYASLCSLADAPSGVLNAKLTDSLCGVIIDRSYNEADAEGQHAYSPIFKSVPNRGDIMHPTKWHTLEYPGSILLGHVMATWSRTDCRPISDSEIAQLNAQTPIVVNVAQ
jgi:hypothetical protein